MIYDHNKNFVGIDDGDLHLLGFATANELVASCENFADFFVKKPGYIHNFKNFQWIDFVLHADAESSKAIIDTGNKSFACEIVIKPFHLLNEPDKEAYSVTLQHVRPLNAAEESGIQTAPSAAPLTPPPAFGSAPEEMKLEAPDLQMPEPELPETPQIPEDPVFNEVPEVASIPEPITIPEDSYIEDPYDMPEETYPDFNKPLEIEDDIFMADETPTPAPVSAPETEFMPEPVAEEAPRAEQPMLGDYLTKDEEAYAHQLDDFKNYAYDPNVAASELGLPVDLIEEFIGDFISQAHEFKDEMLEAATKGDFDNLKLLSHKLKGVAANLRIEDAFEMLAVINNSHDQTEVEAYLKMFYRTIAKLEGKETPELSMPAGSVSETAPVAEEPVVPMPEEANVPDVEAPLPQSDEEDVYAFDI